MSYKYRSCSIFQTCTGVIKSPEDTGKVWKYPKTRKVDCKDSIARHKKWIHCPCCCRVKASSEWHLMDHFAKRHNKEKYFVPRGIKDTRRTIQLIRRLFNKYTHTRKTQEEITWDSILEKTEKVTIMLFLKSKHSSILFTYLLI